MTWAWWRPPFYLRSVLITLKSDDDTGLRGVAWRTRGAWLVLRHASLLKARGEPVEMDGEVVVPLDNVAFVQVL